MSGVGALVCALLAGCGNDWSEVGVREALPRGERVIRLAYEGGCKEVRATAKEDEDAAPFADPLDVLIGFDDDEEEVTFVSDGVRFDRGDFHNQSR